MIPGALTPEQNVVAAAHGSGRRPYVMLVVGGLGFTAAVAQLALLRELLATFSGNELSFGIVLSSWLLLTAAGTWLGTGIHRIKHPLQFIALATAVISLLPILEVVGVRVFRDVFFHHGAVIDPLASMITAVAVLGPFCLGSGAVLTLAARTLAHSNDTSVLGGVYAADAVGGVLGAGVFVFVLAPRFDHAALLCCPAVGLFALAAWIGKRRYAQGLMIGAALAAVAVAAFAIFSGVDAWSTSRQYRTEVVHRAGSPYGRLVVTRDAGQITFFENGVPVAYTGNAIAAEEIVHYALAQRPQARSVLLIGGAASGAVPEVLRYAAVRTVTCVELDPAIIAATRKLAPENLADARCRIVIDDGRRFLQHTAEHYDAILVALPDPTTFQLNRFFTAEFFAEAKRSLAAEGVMVIAVGHYENYISPDSRELLASADRTLRTAFAHVIAVPGSRVFFVASDGVVRRDIAAAVEASGVAPRVVNRDYLSVALAPDRLADLDRAVASPAPINTDFHPVLYYLRLRHWLSQFAFPAAGFAAVVALGLITCLVRLRPIPRMVFAAGFAASTLEIAGLMGIQIFYGSVYQQVGWFVAAFMAGLAAGALVANRAAPDRPPRVVRGLGLAIAVAAALFAVALPHLGVLDRWSGTTFAGQATAILLTFALAGLVGAQFSLSAADTPITSARAAPRLFSADLIGAALGGVAVTAFLLPMFGLVAVCLLTAGLNLLTAALGSRPHGHS